MRYISVFDGSVHIKFKDGREFDVDCTATADEYHDPGCMYLRNGDPGYPPEDDFEITDLEIEFVFDEDGDDVTNQYDNDTAFKDAIDDLVMYELERNHQCDFETLNNPYDRDD